MACDFGDMGKSAKDLFEKGFKFGFLNFDFKTTTSTDVKLNLVGSHDTQSQKLKGSLESKLTSSEGVCIKSKLNTNWLLTTDVEVRDKLREGLTHNLIGTMEAESSQRSLSLKNKFKHDTINLGLDLDFNSKYPLTTASFVLPCPQHDAYSIGAKGVFDSQKMAFTKYIYGAFCKFNDLQLHASLTDHSDIDVSMFQKHKEMELGCKIGWKNQTRETNFSTALMFKPSSNTKMKFRVDQSCNIGLSYTMQLENDASITLCTQLDGKNLESGGHKLGLSFEFGK